MEYNNINEFCAAIWNPQHPYIATIHTSAKITLSDDDGDVTFGSGASAYEAVWSAVGKAMYGGRLRERWVATVYCLDSDGHLIEPTPMGQNALDVLTEKGMCLVWYAHADGSLD